MRHGAPRLDLGAPWCFPLGRRQRPGHRTQPGDFWLSSPGVKAVTCMCTKRAPVGAGPCAPEVAPILAVVTQAWHTQTVTKNSTPKVFLLNASSLTNALLFSSVELSLVAVVLTPHCHSVPGRGQMCPAEGPAHRTGGEVGPLAPTSMLADLLDPLSQGDTKTPATCHVGLRLPTDCHTATCCLHEVWTSAPPHCPKRWPAFPRRWEMELPGSCASEPSLAGAQLQAATLPSRNLPPLAWLEVIHQHLYPFCFLSQRQW